jgi:hypothetical protein
MHLLRNSIALRWVLIWFAVSILLAGITSFLVWHLHKDSRLGPDFSSQFAHIILLSAPWFLWGGALTKFVQQQEKLSAIKRIFLVLGLILLLAGIVLYESALMMDY